MDNLVVCVNSHKCGHGGTCDGGKPHNPEKCHCLECQLGRHIKHIIIQDPPKLSWPCQHGFKCSCGEHK